MAKSPLKYQLTNPLKIKAEPGALDFDTAQTIADKKVKSLCPNPQLVSWYDATTGKSHPAVESSYSGKPGWLLYAESCHGDVTVDINDEQYVFVYSSRYRLAERG